MPQHHVHTRSDVFRKTISALLFFLFAAVCLVSLALAALSGGATSRLLLGLLSAAFIFILVLLLRKCWDQIPLWSLLFLCLGIKLAFVLCFSVPPEGDYHTFLITASDMSQGILPGTRSYLALFPHILGYSGFLSIFLRIFGEAPLVATILNVVLSCVSMLFLHAICDQLISKRAAVWASIAWILFPSQTVYNLYVLSEPLYTALLFAAFWLLLCFRKHQERVFSGWRALLPGAGLGLLCVFIQAVRPVGMILLFAILLYFLFFTKCQQRRTVLLFSLAAALLFLGGTKVVSLSEDAYLGEKSGSFGYSIYVGLDGRYGGMWNTEAAALLAQYAAQPGATAAKIQAAMLEDAKENFKNRSFSLCSFAAAKLRNLMSFDYAAVDYYSGDTFTHKAFLSACSDAFWYMLLLLAGVGAVLAALQRPGDPLLIAALYGLGLVAAHMLTEAAQRYHYSMVLPLLPLAAFALEFGAERFERHLTKKKS